jgi:hypothetical protein
MSVEDAERELRDLSLQEKSTRDEEEGIDSWESLLDSEDHPCQLVNKDDTAESNSKVKTSNKVKLDYYSLKAEDLRPKSRKKTSDFVADWVVEVYDFHPSMKTPDIVGRLYEFGSESYVIKWVDDTHALVIFSSSELAERAIATSLQIFKIRPLSEATLQSVSTAQRFADSLRPVPDVSQKPKTTSTVARRMISNALGVRLNVSSEKVKAEREALRKARDEKKSASQKKDYWNDSD